MMKQTSLWTWARTAALIRDTFYCLKLIICIYSADVTAEEMQTLWGEVCLLSVFWRQEGGEVEEEVEGWRRRWRGGGGVPPDSLEPCCNSLIETEWDVLITPVVKTEGGGWRQGGCVLWSPGSGSPSWGGTPPINTDALWWGASRDSTRTRTRTRTPPADLHLHSGFTLQDQTSALCSHERTLFYRVDGPEQPAGRDRRRLRLWTHHLWDALRESAGLLLQTKDCWEFTRTGGEQEPEPGRTQSAAPNLTRQQPRYVQNNQSISADPFLLRLEY